jgi:hypothetical protein
VQQVGFFTRLRRDAWSMKHNKDIYASVDGVTYITVQTVSFCPCLFDVNIWDMQYSMRVENYLHQMENYLLRKNMQAVSNSILSKFHRRLRRLPLCFQILNLPYTKLIVFLVFLREWLRKLSRILQLRSLQFSTPPSSSQFYFPLLVYFVSGQTFHSFLLLFYGLTFWHPSFTFKF